MNNPQLAICTLFSIILCAQTKIASAEPELFGAAKLSVAAIDDDAGDAISVSSHSSRVGIKGSTETRDGMEIIYRFVWQIDMTDDSKSSDDHIKSREQFVGFKDSWGELRVGRFDTPYKKAGKKHVEFFSDTWADYNNIISKPLDIRADDSVSYYQTMDNIKVSAMYAAGDDTTAGNNAGRIASATAEVKSGDINLAASFTDVDQLALGLKLVLGYAADGTAFGFIVEQIDPDGNAENLTNLLGSFKHRLDDRNTLKLVAGRAEGANDPVMLAAAIDHKLNPSTTVYVLAAAGRDGGLNGASKLVGDAAVLALGVVAKF